MTITGSIAGLRGSGTWSADERPTNFRELILWQNPNGKAPLFAMTAKAKKANTDDPQFSWWEEIVGIVRVELNGAVADENDTSFVIHNSTAINAAVDSDGRRGGVEDVVVGDIFMVENATSGVTAAYTDELVRVTAIDTGTDTLTVARNITGTSGTSIADGSYLVKVGNAYTEGSASPEAASRNPRKFTNYCQIFKTAYEVTGTLKATNARTGNALKNDKKRRAFDHSTAIEMAMLFGKSSESNGNTANPLRTTGGLLEHLATASRVTVKGSAYVGASGAGADTFFDDIADVFDYDGNGAGDERIVFCGNSALNTINKIARGAGQIEFMEQVKYYGMNLTKWTIPQGTLYFKSHPLMNQHPQFSKAMFIVEPTGVRYRPLRDTTPQDNIQNNDEDTEKGQWLTEAGFEFNYMECMKFIGNVTYSAS